MKWDIQSDQTASSIEQVIDVLLQARQIEKGSEANFFSPIHPVDLSLDDVGIDSVEMSKAVNRIKQAKDRGEYVMVFGDYDADGVTATAILWETLYEMGVKAMPFIPNREKHGYGISDRSLDDILKGRRPDLIITVDNGIVAHGAFERLQKEGIDAIITDHHLPEKLKVESDKLKGDQAQSKEKARHPEQSSEFASQTDSGSKVKGQQKKVDQALKKENDCHPVGKRDLKSEYTIESKDFIFPPALAVVHSTKLCGATVAWFLARQLNPTKAKDLLDLCAIGTIADQMILQNANRSFAYHGLNALQQTKRIGLLNLYEVAGIKAKDITSGSVNFAIAPRINAMGRLSSALDALRALCTKDKSKSLELIAQLQDTNKERQELTWSMVDQALERQDEWKDEKIIVLSSDAYHEGVIGLIAGKLMEEFTKPAIVISMSEKGAKASARSVPGVNIVELIRQVRDELLDVGGHPMAAGFSLDIGKIESVTRRLQQIAKEQIADELLVARLPIELIIPLQLVTLDFYQALQKFEPFGNGNADPVFGFKDVQVLQAYAIGREKKHLKLVIGNTQGHTVECIGFGFGRLETEVQAAQTIDLAATISLNEWNGRKSVQLVVKDVVLNAM